MTGFINFAGEDINVIKILAQGWPARA
jgi:hypothetical protein